MQQLGTYQTRISDYGGVNRSAGDAVHWQRTVPRFTDGCSGSCLLTLRREVRRRR